MYNHLDRKLPLVVVCNISETFYEFLSRAGDVDQQDHLIHGEQYRGDRALVWLTDRKLAFLSFPVEHADYLTRNFNYENTIWAAPDEPTPFLCRDIVREPRLIGQLVEYAGPERVVQLVPYATTDEFYQLVEVLEQQYGLKVLLPETPHPDARWVRDIMDTKSGFRALASRWLPNAEDLLPVGFSCQDADLAAYVTHWFCTTGRNCLIKADIGENGIGNVIHSSDCADLEDIKERLRANPFLSTDWLTVEELITSPGPLSPSLELFVPAPEVGPPMITYLSKQVFLEFGDFCGVLVSKELLETPWYKPLAEAGLLIADRMQRLGYVGHFDLDAVIDEYDRPYLLEINTRRTGGTHTHEFARHFFGPDYLEEVALLSDDTMDSGGLPDFEALQRAVGNLLYPIGDEKRGVVITGTSALEAGEFGCIIVGINEADVLALQQELREAVVEITRERSL